MQLSPGWQRVLYAAFMTPTRRGWGIPVVVKGSMGIGKTSIIEQMAEEMQAFFSVLTLSNMEAVEAKGHPFLDEISVAIGGKIEKRRQMGYAPPDWALQSNQALRAIVFLDELNQCLQQTFAAFARVINERACGSYQLGEHVRIVAAMNPTNMAAAAGGVDLPPQTANRLCHIDGSMPAFEQFASWLALNETPKPFELESAAISRAVEEPEEIVMRQWAEAFAKASSEVIGYLAARPGKQLVEPDPLSPEASGAWPSRRSWEMLTRARASSWVHNLSGEEALMFESGCIGKAHTGEFRTWIADQDLPNARQWLQGQIEFESDFTRLDRTQAFLIAAAIEWSRMEKHKRQKELERLVGFYSTLTGRRDTLVASMHLLSGNGTQEIKEEIFALPIELRKVFSQIGTFKTTALAAGGIR